MNLRTLYGLIYGFIGLILSLLFSSLLCGLIIAILRIFIYGIDVFPSWVDMTLLGVFLLINVVCLFYCIKLGMDKGFILEQKNEIDSHKKALTILAIVIVLFVSLIFTAGVMTKLYLLRSMDFHNRAAVMDMHHRQISDFDIYQEENAVGVSFSIEDKSNVSYLITVSLSVVGDENVALVEEEQTVLLKFKTQSFNFLYTFEEIEKAYREKVAQYMSDESLKTGQDVYIAIEASINLVEDEIKGPGMKTYSLPRSSAKGGMLFFIKCDKENCRVVQEKSK